MAIQVRQLQLIAEDSGPSEEAADTSHHTCATECLALVRARFDDAAPGLVIKLDTETDLPEIRCHPIGLRNALLNLVMNARDAMAGQGLVEIKVSRSGEKRDRVELSVTDTGLGMSPETARRAFDPFFTTKSEGLGGLGLPMVERFVQESGGRISIESMQGVGTIVRLQLQSAPGRTAPCSPQSQ